MCVMDVLVVLARVQVQVADHREGQRQHHDLGGDPVQRNALRDVPIPADARPAVMDWCQWSDWKSANLGDGFGG